MTAERELFPRCGSDRSYTHQIADRDDVSIGPGAFELLVGRHSRDPVMLSAQFRITA